MIFAPIFAIKAMVRCGWIVKLKRIWSKRCVSFVITCQGIANESFLSIISYDDKKIFLLCFILGHWWIWWHIRRSVWFYRWIAFLVCQRIVTLAACFNALASKANCTVNIKNCTVGWNWNTEQFFNASLDVLNFIEMILLWYFNHSVWMQRFSWRITNRISI